MRIGLVGCGKSKRDGSHPARELYTGALFRKALAYCEGSYGRVFVLSAAHGLVPPDRVIEAYDLSPPPAGWDRLVVKQLRAVYRTGDTVFIHAGSRYADPVAALFGPAAETPLKGLGVGQRLRWYKERGF